jgi:hypothetical protein
VGSYAILCVGLSIANERNRAQPRNCEDLISGNIEEVSANASIDHCNNRVDELRCATQGPAVGAAAVSRPASSLAACIHRRLIFDIIYFF